MKSYVIGVDGGSTKTHLALFDTDGRLCDIRNWGPLNPEAIGGYEALEREFGQLVAEALDANGVTTEQIAYAVIGTAGVDSRWQHQIISDIVRRQGLRRFSLFNDAYLGVYAGTPAGVGICTISGTGCTIAGIDPAGEMLQIGGLGDMSADMGGSSILGMCVITSVYASQFRKGRPTLLTDMLYQKLGIENKRELAEELPKMAQELALISDYNHLLFEAAEQGDEVSIGLLCDSAENYARGIHCMVDELHLRGEDPLYIVLAGSVFVKEESPFLIKTLKDSIAARLPELPVSYTLLDRPPVAGAVIKALQTLHGNEDFRDSVVAQL